MVQGIQVLGKTLRERACRAVYQLRTQDACLYMIEAAYAITIGASLRAGSDSITGSSARDGSRSLAVEGEEDMVVSAEGRNWNSEG